MAVVATLSFLTLVGCSSAPEPRLSVRLWDPQVAEAYRVSLDEFERETGIPVDVVVVPWASYWTQLRTDVAGRTVDDLYWMNSTSYRPYAESGSILPVAADQLADQSGGWSPAAIEQFTSAGQVWGVPQITDPGIALFYNADLLDVAGLDANDVSKISWNPSAADDSLRETARSLTLDDNGNHPRDPGFDADSTAQYGFGASNDLNAVLLQFLAGNGAAWQRGDSFVFADEPGVETIDYLVRLINVEHVAPPAADSNPPVGGDYVRDEFIKGRVALFPTGAYNLANVAEGAAFRWGVAPFPSGPAGSLSVTNSVVLASSATTDMPREQQLLAEWLGSAEGQRAIGISGSALPAAIDAQADYRAFWAEQRVDITAMLEILDNGHVQAPQGARYGEASDALQPILNSVFTGTLEADRGIREAEAAANEAIAD